MTLAAAFAQFAPLVRRRLAAFGVREADLPDLSQEVFLIVHRKADSLHAVDHMDRWLGAICRRVAAGYRRRATHRLEVLGCDAPEAPDPGGDARADEDDERELLAGLRGALDSLDDESRDLLALHDGGDMPLAALARLVEHDRKTVRRRLVEARVRVSRWLGAAAAGSVVAGAPVAARGRPAVPVASGFPVVRRSTEPATRVIGNVTVADWRGPPVEAAAIEAELAQAPHGIARCGGTIAYLAIVEPTVHPPALDARLKIVEAFDEVGPFLGAFAAVLWGAHAPVNRAILEGLAVLARPRFPLRCFDSLREAAAWLCSTGRRGTAGPLAPADVLAAAEGARRIGQEVPEGP
jgi:RNA polymerase sigma-70 factor (ECF subfamily)